ncbi:MAG: hypothetical protein ACK5VE_03545 [Alphaproteobacteria bacterium]
MFDRALAEQYLSLLEYELGLQEAEDHLLRFCEVTMPDARKMHDIHATRYKAGTHHVFMADVMMQVEAGAKKKVIMNLPPRHGKACADDTPVLTPKGWVTHGDLKAGDTVYGPDGLPTLVLATKRWEPDMLEVEITNGEVICVHRNHEWTVEVGGQVKTVETNWFLSAGERGPKAGQRRNLWYGARGKRGSRAVYRLPPVSAIEFPDAILPAHPYALGVWLGDGSKSDARIVGVDDEVFEGIAACGYTASASGIHATTGVRWSNYTSGIPNVRTQLSLQLHQLGLIGKKRIPEIYLRASLSQRLQLLAGLMDTDGNADPKGRCRIVTAEADLADDIFDLCSTLGFHPYRTVQAAHTSTSGIIGRRDTITIGFQPTMEIPCRVPRKRVTRFADQKTLAIADVRAGSAHGCQSIQVDRADGIYLVGKTLVPTHNTELCTKRFCAWYSARHPEHDIIVATYNEKFAADFAAEVREIMASVRFRQIFPEYYLTQQSSERLTTYANGKIYFLGRRSSTTGRGGNLILVDDPTKDDKEIRYPAFREDCWQWFTQTLLTRRHNDKAAIVVSQCMTGDTPVLMADGTEVPLRDVRAGDLVATYDNGILSSAKITKWSSFGPDPVLSIRTKSGNVVRANARHPFLVQKPDGGVEWRRTGMLKKGDAILRVITENGRASLWRRRNTSDFEPDEIVSIEPDGIEEVFDITVERTENFIANGLVSHNTRWHEDDIVGRISDKTNPAYSKSLAEGFEIINIPAIAEADDPLNRKPGEALWPERFGLTYLEEMRGANPVSFSALYQCDPTPEDGVFYRPEELFEYDLDELPERLTFYVVSDHAVSLKAHNDPSVLCPFGVCANGIAWVMPDLIWRRMDTKETVEEMVDIIRRRKPVFWYAEKGHISKAIGPFLKDRMQQEGVYCPVIEDQPVLDKIQRAQSGRAKSAQGRIRYPRFAPWWPKAKSEMLKFPNGRFDDFVDVISMIGMKIGSQAGPSRVLSKTRHEPGTFGFMLEQFRNQDRDDEARKERAGW